MDQSEVAEATPKSYSFEAAEICPILAESISSAQSEFKEIKKKQVSGNRTVNIWDTKLKAGNAECQIIDIGNGSPSYVCSVALPGKASAINWYGALKESLLECMKEPYPWTSDSWDDRSGKTSLLQSPNKVPPFITIRYYSTDKMLSAPSWTGVVSISNHALRPD